MKSNKKAFSVAEAMVTLLIVSIALAAAAPIMSRKMKSDIDNAARSKWNFTLNRQNITRESGNVGIGVSTLQNPQAKLDVRVSDTDESAIKIYKNNSLVLSISRDGFVNIEAANGTSTAGIINIEDKRTNAVARDAIITKQNGTWRNALRREGGFYTNIDRTRTDNYGLAINNTNANKVVAYIDTLGKMTLNIPNDTVRKMISIQQNGTEKAWIKSDGSSSFSNKMTLNAPDNTVRKMISIKQNGTENAWINSDGSSSFASEIPRGAVMAFNLGSCPTTWHPLTNDYTNATGAFIRNIGGNAGTLGTIQESAAPNITGKITYLISRKDPNVKGAFETTYHKDKDATRNPGEGGAPHWWDERTLSFNANNSSNVYQNGITEVRPKNIALLYCVKD